MPVIRIDAEVLEALKRHAVDMGLVFEPPNTTLRKILSLDEKLSPDNMATVDKTICNQDQKERKPIKRLLRIGVRARHIQNGLVTILANTPNELAIKLKIRPAKYVLRGKQWDGVTYGVEGYRTILHAFTSNGYEVDIGDGWGQYLKEEIKPYDKFDVRKFAK
ncbi:hypothetical protein X793_05575 [Dehalococcoides mccartyi CG4]|uniref:hypothetical protein n=1 Tax=Dehalococcoides mccartyi TaxID=61435 RepID=UPI0004E0680E|nr:hypothetical protein [Dehalococcoides mccartyi]AII60220.1 hypothetical protein X793_05575 [Dehalococcoides mccartyi CG4]